MMTNDEIGRRKKIGVVIILMALCTLVYIHRYFLLFNLYDLFNHYNLYNIH